MTFMFFVYSLDRRLPLRFGKSLLLPSSGLLNSLKRGISGSSPPTIVFFEVLEEGVGNGSSALATLGIELNRLGYSLSLLHSAMMVLSSISTQPSSFSLGPRNLRMMAGFACSGLNNSPNSEKSLPYKARSGCGSSSLIILASSFTLLKTGRSLCLYPSYTGSSCSSNFITLPESWKTIFPELAYSITITLFCSYLRLSSYAFIFSSWANMTLDFNLSFSFYNSCICLRNSATWYSLRAFSR